MVTVPQLAQLLTGIALVLFLGSGFGPARRHAAAVRIGILALYVAGCAVLLGWVLLGRGS